MAHWDHFHFLWIKFEESIKKTLTARFFLLKVKVVVKVKEKGFWYLVFNRFRRVFRIFLGAKGEATKNGDFFYANKFHANASRYFGKMLCNAFSWSFMIAYSSTFPHVWSMSRIFYLEYIRVFCGTSKRAQITFLRFSFSRRSRKPFLRRCESKKGKDSRLSLFIHF